MKNSNLRPIGDIYEECASFWAQERARTAFFEKKYMDWVLNHLSPAESVLDLGCGSGFPIADYFLRYGLHVTGIDVASAMIQIASEKFPQGEWLVADMKTLSLGRKFSAIIAWDSFFHLGFVEQENMFPLFRNHLSNRGVLVFTSGPERGEAIGDMNGNPLFHASLSPDEYRSLLDRNGFEVAEFHPREASGADRTIWLSKVIK